MEPNGGRGAWACNWLDSSDQAWLHASLLCALWCYSGVALDYNHTEKHGSCQTAPDVVVGCYAIPLLYVMQLMSLDLYGTLILQWPILLLIDCASSSDNLPSPAFSSAGLWGLVCYLSMVAKHADKYNQHLLTVFKAKTWPWLSDLRCMSRARTPCFNMCQCNATGAEATACQPSED